MWLVPFPLHQSGHTSQGPLCIKNPLIRARSKAYAVSLTGVLARVWVRCCGGGQAKHWQDLYTESKKPGFHHADDFRGIQLATATGYMESTSGR